MSQVANESCKNWNASPLGTWKSSEINANRFEQPFCHIKKGGTAPWKIHWIQDWETVCLTGGDFMEAPKNLCIFNMLTKRFSIPTNLLEAWKRKNKQKYFSAVSCGRQNKILSNGWNWWKIAPNSLKMNEKRRKNSKEFRRGPWPFDLKEWDVPNNREASRKLFSKKSQKGRQLGAPFVFDNKTLSNCWANNSCWSWSLFQMSFRL